MNWQFVSKECSNSVFMRFFVILLSILFLSGSRIEAQVQIVPADSAALMDFIILQEQIPGMSYRFVLEEKNLPEEVLNQAEFGFAKTDSGFYSIPFENWDSYLAKKDEVTQLQLNSRCEILIYTIPSSLEAVRDYLSGIIRMGDYQPILEKKNPKPDLVALAYKDPYTPFQKFKLIFISDYKLFIVTAIIVFFFLVSTGLTLYMVILKIQKSRKDSLVLKYNQDILEPLTILPFEKEVDEIQAMSNDELYSYFPKELLQKPLYQEVLADNIISLNKKMKGDFKAKLKTLYVKLGLDTVSIKLLSDRRWDKKTLGLVQINEMDLVEALPKVEKLVNNESFNVRSHAVSTLLNLSSTADLKFLRDLEFPLSNWQQMNYLRIIKFVSHQKPLNLELLFDSKNQSVRLFVLKLIRMLGLYDLIETLSKFSGQANDIEKIEILKTYQSLGAHMEVGFVNECLQSGNLEVLSVALEASATIGDEQSRDLILGILSQSDLPQKFKKSALNSLKELDEGMFEEYISSSTDAEVLSLGKHIKDPLLKHV